MENKEHSLYDNLNQIIYKFKKNSFEKVDINDYIKLNSILEEILQKESLEEIFSLNDQNLKYFMNIFLKNILNNILDEVIIENDSELNVILLFNIYQIFSKFNKNKKYSSFFDNINFINNLTRKNVHEETIIILYHYFNKINEYRKQLNYIDNINIIDEFIYTLLIKLNEIIFLHLKELRIKENIKNNIKNRMIELMKRYIIEFRSFYYEDIISLYLIDFMDRINRDKYFEINEQENINKEFDDIIEEIIKPIIKEETNIDLLKIINKFLAKDKYLRIIFSCSNETSLN